MLPIVVCLLNSIFIHEEEIYRYLYIQQNDAKLMMLDVWLW